MIQLETIALPPKIAFGFFSTVPFFGANAKFRKKVVRLLRSRSSFRNEIESIWSLFPFQTDIQKILECIRVYNGWPNALFLPSDSFLALAPLEGHYESFTADYDTVNSIFFLLHPKEKKQGDMIRLSLVACGDIPVIDTERILPEHTVADVLQLLAGSSLFEEAPGVEIRKD